MARDNAERSQRRGARAGQRPRPAGSPLLSPTRHSLTTVPAGWHEQAAHDGLGNFAERLRRAAKHYQATRDDRHAADDARAEINRGRHPTPSP